MIYESVEDIPADFNPRMEVVSCYFEFKDEILLLQRQDHKPQGGTWGVPAGKVDHGESLTRSMRREILEETGVRLFSRDITYHGYMYVRYPEIDFTYHTFQARFNKKPAIEINREEHKAMLWTPREKSLKMNLIPDLDYCIKSFYKL
ncbi:MAG: NUDIX hydrolase [Nanobdellota archaeon]